MISRIFLTGIFALVLHTSFAQNQHIINYINTYKHLAIAEMQRTGVPASIKLAQGIIETQAGESDLVRRSANHFGIKCKSNWSGDKVYHDDDEAAECFRAYPTAEASYKDHSEFLQRNQRYAFLFHLKQEDYKGWARGLKKAGYATNPKYTEMLIRYIENYDLNFYSYVAMGKKNWQDEDARFAIQVTQPAVQKLEPVVAVNYSNTQTFKKQDNSYPQGVFSINGAKAVWAEAGTPLMVIAENHKMQFRNIIHYNDFPESIDILREGQLVFLQRKKRHGANSHHIANGEDNLHTIAQKEGIRLDNLLSYNKSLTEDIAPSAGTAIYLQKDAVEKQHTPQEIQASTVHQTTVKQHTVQAKETLYAIAQKYNTTVTLLQQINQLSGTDISIGQQLLIPGN